MAQWQNWDILVHCECMTSVNSWQMVSTYVRGSWCKIFSEILFKCHKYCCLKYVKVCNRLTNNEESSYFVSSIPTLSTFNHLQFVPFFIHITAEYTHVTWSLNNWIFAPVQRLSVQKVVHNCKKNKNHSKTCNSDFNIYKINMVWWACQDLEIGKGRGLK